MDTKTIGLLGGRGYVGQEIIKLLVNHKYLNITSIFSSSKAGQSVPLNVGNELLYQDLSLDKIVLFDEMLLYWPCLIMNPRIMLI
jgi:N-acetyl-gamma-glutamylphosphate reductase